MMVRTFLGQLLLVAACIAAVLPSARADDKNLFQQYVEKFGPPGPEHKMLEPLVGTWQAEVKMWMEPGQTPHTSTGTLTRKSILDGRFIHEDFKGKLLDDKTFRGLGTLGYDRAKRKYVTVWIDSISTAIGMSKGDYDESSRTWTFKQQDTCPITGKHLKMRDTLRIVNPNEQEMEMYRQLGDEKEMKTMEIRLTRQK